MYSEVNEMMKSKNYYKRWFKWAKEKSITSYLCDRLQSELFDLFLQKPRGQIFPIDKAFNLIYNARRIRDALVFDHLPEVAGFVWNISLMIAYDSINTFCESFSFGENSTANLVRDIDKILTNENRYVDGRFSSYKEIENSGDPILAKMNQLVSIGIFTYRKDEGYRASDEFRRFLELRRFVDTQNIKKANGIV